LSINSPGEAGPPPRRYLQGEISASSSAWRITTAWPSRSAWAA